MQKNTAKTVVTITHSLGARDKYSQGHMERVSRYAGRLAARLKLPPEEIENIRIGGLLHDIGKIGFSDDVFQNEDKRPPASIIHEIKKHPMRGKAILKDLEFRPPIIDYVYSHHEREDGSGYPRGLHGDEIPLGAKIIAIADTFDAITTDRPYQLAKTLKEAFAILRSLSGRSLNAELVEAFIAEIRENGA